MRTPTAIPTWLSDNVPDLSPMSKQVIDTYPTTASGFKDRDSQLESMFTHVIHKISDGYTFPLAVESGPYQISAISMMKWILKDPHKTKELEETQAAIAEIDMMNIVDIADANGTLEDATRSTIRIKARQQRAEVYNRKKYGKDASLTPLGHSGPININFTGLTLTPTPTTLPTPTPITIDMESND